MTNRSERPKTNNHHHHQIDWGLADGEKCSRYHQNSDEIGFLFRFGPFSCHHWWAGPSQKDIRLRPWNPQSTETSRLARPPKVLQSLAVASRASHKKVSGKRLEWFGGARGNGTNARAGTSPAAPGSNSRPVSHRSNIPDAPANGRSPKAGDGARNGGSGWLLQLFT